jgi:hypothetical protein
MTSNKKLNVPIELQPVSIHPLDTSVNASLPDTVQPVQPIDQDSLLNGGNFNATASQDGRATPLQAVNSQLPPVDSGPAFIFLAAATVLE